MMERKKGEWMNGARMVEAWMNRKWMNGARSKKQ
jgi:hypothetical protein